MLSAADILFHWPKRIERTCPLRIPAKCLRHEAPDRSPAPISIARAAISAPPVARATGFAPVADPRRSSLRRDLSVVFKPTFIARQANNAKQHAHQYRDPERKPRTAALISMSSSLEYSRD
jgi:hypothetical protein